MSRQGAGIAAYVLAQKIKEAKENHSDEITINVPLAINAFHALLHAAEIKGFDWQDVKTLKELVMETQDD